MDAASRDELWRAGGDTGPADAADAFLAAAPPAASPSTTPAAPAWSEDPGPPTTTLLLRHGQTALSVDKRFSGTGDPELTALGLQQAAAAAEALAAAGATAVVSSPLRRARQTAEQVVRVTGLDLAVEEGLRETDFGDWEGSTFAEVRARWPRELDAWLADPAVAPPSGESFESTATRVRQARDRVLATYGGQTVVLVSHVTPIKTLLRIALDAPPSALYRMHLDLACLSDVRWYADGPAVVRGLNDTHHLAGIG